MTMTIQETLDSLKITVESQFVPFSQSRNKDSEHKSLNWKVTVKRDGHDVVTTDYSAGIAHCPGHKLPTPKGWMPSTFRRKVTDLECESGVAQKLSPFGFDSFTPRKVMRDGRSKAMMINPDAESVVWSLVMEYDVLDAGGFEYWCADLGFDTDSRKAESTYKQCLEIALQMRAAFGESGMDQLQTVYVDY
jgi:hypothetical protein